MRFTYILILLLLCLNFNSFSQENLLEKKVTVTYKETTVRDVLADLRKKYSINFSYADNKIPVNKKISLEAKDIALKQVLEQVFEGTDVSYKLVGKQIVLTRNPAKKTPDKKTNDKEDTNTSSSLSLPDSIQDSLVSADTGSVLINEEELVQEEIKQQVSASVKDTTPVNPQFESYQLQPSENKENLRKQYLSEKRKLRDQYFNKMDSITDANHPSQGEDDVKTNFRKLMRSLRNEVTALKDTLDNSIHIDKPIFPLPGKAKEVADTTEEASSRRDIDEKDEDEKGYTHTLAQFSFVPPLSTNGFLNSVSVNHLSFNLVAGYAAGLEGGEFAGLVNVENDYARGAQFAGFANIVKNDFSGYQGAGFCNIAGGATQGGQFAGFLNISGDSTYAFQGAGFTNISNGNTMGGQFAGFLNVSNGAMYGPQGAGFLNTVKGDMVGFQGAGFANVVAGRTSGFQGAGFANVVSGNVNGFQGAGFINTAGNVKGVQASGFINIAQKVKGAQLGFINIADSVSGVQLGFLSVSKKGYRRLELFTNETFYGNLAFKTGTKYFHNILAVSYKPESLTGFSWAVGYGLGTELNLSKRFLMNFDVIGYHVNESRRWESKLNLLAQAKLNGGILISKKTSMFIGPTFSVKITELNPDATFSPYIEDIKEHTEYQDKVAVITWTGFNAGIRF